MPNPLPPDQLTEDQRTQEVAALFAKGILRLQHSNRLAFSTQKPLTGEQEKETHANETGRQGAIAPHRP